MPPTPADAGPPVRPRLGAAFVRLGGAGLFCAALVGLSIAFVDRPTATWVHATFGGGAGWFTSSYLGPALKFGPFSLMASPSAAAGFIAAGVFPALAFAAYAGWRPRARGRVALALCVAVFAANEVNSHLKGVFGRTWPESWLGDNPSWIRDGAFGFAPFHGGPDYASFPSGHTTIIAAVATVLWIVRPDLRAVWAALIAVVVVGLVGGGYHFVSDTIAGVFLGAAVGIGVARLMLAPDGPDRPRP